MRLNAPRLGLLFVSFLLIGVAVVACAAPQTTTSSTTGGNVGPNGNVFQTPNPGLNTPTPTFPGFTVGAWPSQYSPGNNATITIYVICRIQDPTMQNPPTPATNVPVILTFAPAANVTANFPTLTATTGPDGIAAFTFQINDPSSGVPISVSATATYEGNSYVAQTFFTPNPEAKPTPTAGATGTATGTATP
ncbi:MAG: hypothetical protein ACLQUY_25720 [Ktedonobacterales bacterium]